jgi:hypothetical protein
LENIRNKIKALENLEGKNVNINGSITSQSYLNDIYRKDPSFVEKSSNSNNADNETYYDFYDEIPILPIDIKV